MHRPVGVANRRDIEQCADLIAEFLPRIDGDFDCRPDRNVKIRGNRRRGAKKALTNGPGLWYNIFRCRNDGIDIAG